MKPWQWKFHHNSSEYVKKQMDSFVTIQLLANPPSCITALYIKNTASISTRCSLQIRKRSDVSMPSQLTPNVWILPTAPSVVTTTITLICTGETTKFIKVKKPIHVLQLPTACSANPLHFHLHLPNQRLGKLDKLSHNAHNPDRLSQSAMQKYPR